MTETPKDPGKAGMRPGAGPQQAKRPTATLDLQATEIERRDMPGSDADASAKAPPEAAASNSGAASAKTDDAKPGASKAAAVKPRRNGSGVGGFLSHAVAGLAGAAAALFGADYLANLGFDIPTFSAAQVQQLNRRIASMELSNTENGPGATANLLKEQIQAMKAQLDQVAPAPAAIGNLQAQQKQLAERAGKLEQLFTAQAANTAPAERIAKLEDQFKMMAQSGAAGQGGQPGQMAALVTKLDGIGVTLDERIAEMRKSLQGDMQKQSAHFEDRLSEVDKGMAVETLKAGGKAVSDEIVGMKTTSSKLAQDIATVGAGAQQLRQDLAALKTTTSGLETQLQAATGSFAKTDQLSTVNATTTKLQADVAAIAARDQSREQGANRILLSLQLANLKRVVERGGPYAKELADVKRVAPKELDLSALDANAETGLATTQQLASEFKDMTWSLVSADAKPSDDGSLIGQLWQGARSVVQVRKTDATGDAADAVVARTEAKLQRGDLDGAMRDIGQLKGDARKAADPWIAKLAARLSLDQGLAGVDASLLKLMGPSASN